MTIAERTCSVRTSSLGWMIQRIAGRLDRAMEARLAPHDLTLQQFAVLMTVLEVEGLSQSDIGSRFGMPAYTISRAIDHLEEHGLLERQPHPTSRRSHTIYATHRAHQLAPTLFGIVQEVNDELTAGMTDQQRAKFRDMLEGLL